MLCLLEAKGQAASIDVVTLESRCLEAGRLRFAWLSGGAAIVCLGMSFVFQL